MTIEAMPAGDACDIQCLYCYETHFREAGNFTPETYDLEAMKAALLTQIEKVTDPKKRRVTLFGGEPLLMPVADLRELARWARVEHIGLGLQTNGTLFTDEIHDIVRQHRIGVCISIDGPGPLNDARWAGSIEKTRAMTARTELAIERLTSEQRPPSLIVTLHQLNASPARLPALIAWFVALSARGITRIRLHLLEDDHDAVTGSLVLAEPDLIAALAKLADLHASGTVRIELFDEILRLQRGRSDVSCVFKACDPFTTHAVNAVGGDGQVSNCGRVEKMGVPWRKADTPSFERQLILASTPQDDGGCRGCPFFVMCTGHCPGSAEARDWRNRSAHCGTLKWLFGEAEKLLTFLGETPVSKRSDRRQIEQRMIGAWRRGRNMSLAEAVRS